MKVTQKETAPGKIELTISVSPNKYEKFLRGTALKMGENMTIPGFRAGRAPYQRIKAQIGEMKLLSESLQRIAHHTYIEAVEQQKLKPAMPPKINVTKVAPGNDVVYTAEVVVLPEVKMLDLQSVKIKVKPVKVEDKEVKSALKELQKMRGSEALKKESAKMGDKVECDIKISGIKELDAKAQSIVLGQTKMVDGFADNVIGMKAGDKKTFKQKFPEKYHQKKLAGKEVDMSVAINKVWQVTLPELNDGFAKNVSKKFKNLAELKDQLRKNIKQEKQVKEVQRQEQEMLEIIIAKSTFSEIASELLDDVKARMLDEFKASVAQYGGKWEEYLKQVKKSEDELKEQFTREAKKRTNLDAIVAAVVDKENLDVDNKEVEAEVNTFLMRYGNIEQAKQQIDLAQLRASMRGRLLNRKAIEWLRSKVNVYK